MSQIPFFFRVYGWATLLLYPLYVYGVLPHRLRQKKEDPERVQEKLGYATRPRPKGPVIWIHGASVGESLSLQPLIETIQNQNQGVTILMTSGTTTSAQMIQDRFPKSVIHQYAPLDFPHVVERFLNHWQPSLMIWVESELWPTTLFKAHGRGIPQALMNMRLSPRSFHRWMGVKAAFFRLLSCFDVVLTQTKMLKDLLATSGFRQAQFCGNLKMTATVPPLDPRAVDELKRVLGDRPVWMAASTHPGEEEICLRAHGHIQRQAPLALHVLVLRHPHRAGDIKAYLEGEGHSVQLYSSWLTGDRRIPVTASIFLVDQVGVMEQFFAVVPIVCVAGSLVSGIGGHNILEPLRQGCVTLHGPYMANFQEIADQAAALSATRLVETPQEIADAVLAFYAGDPAITDLQHGAARLITGQQEVLTQIFETLRPLLESIQQGPQNHLHPHPTPTPKSGEAS